MIADASAMTDALTAFLTDKSFPCVAARAAVAKQQLQCFTAGHMACPKDDKAILQFLYDFISSFRSATHPFHSAAAIFQAPGDATEQAFDALMWQRLQAISDLDAEHFTYDKRVNANASAPDFSFSLMEEAFFIIGLHPNSSRPARRFSYPALIFNPHAQFEQLKAANQYSKMKLIVRRRDTAYSGSVNPMLQDFGEASEVMQYSGMQYDRNWQCPLKIHHG